MSKRRATRGWDRKLKDLDQGIDKAVADRKEAVVFELHHRIIENTPVWSGRTVANWQVSVGAPFKGEINEVENPPEFAPTQTPKPVPLGTEDRRPANEAEALKSLHATDFSQPYTIHFITNNVPYVEGLETGRLLPSKGYVNRHPVPMVGTAIEELKLIAQTGGFR